LVGDIRHTGRRVAADGWIFLRGQTLGASSSSASLKGEKYRALFEIAKYWEGNEGDAEVWGDNDTVKLPNSVSRVMAGADETNIGGYYGSNAAKKLTTSHLPVHSHTAQSVASHKHALGNAGNHGPQLYSPVYAGSGAGRADWSYFEGKARPNFQNHILHATRTAGNHTHTMGNAGGHTHAINSAGEGKGFSITQATVRFMVEVKYQQ